MKSKKEVLAIQHTRAWLEQIVLAYQLCPFAQKPYDLKQVRIISTTAKEEVSLLMTLLEECRRLKVTPAKEIETTLIVLEFGMPDFLDFWDFCLLAEDQMSENGYEGLLQLASFHPNYQFGGTKADDVENYTNRSPFPILHLLREDSISKALDHHAAPDQIPARNIQLMKEKGSGHWKNLLKSIKAIH